MSDDKVLIEMLTMQAEGRFRVLDDLSDEGFARSLGGTYTPHPFFGPPDFGELRARVKYLIAWNRLLDREAAATLGR